MSGSSSNFTQTPNLGLFKPVYAADVGFWGTHLNANADTLDTLLGPKGVFNVKDLGAAGDGTTDDHGAFSAALANAAGGGTVVVPAGTYNIGTALAQAITGSMSFEGAGSGVTTLSFSGATDGLTFSLAAGDNVHVSGLTIIRAAAGATYANTGLSITTGVTPTLRQGLTSISDIAFIGGTSFWATGISVFNTSNVSLEHISYVAPNATGLAGSIGTAIAIAGLSASSYLVEAKLNDINTQGGSVGLRIGDFVQGVYLTQSTFIGNDYGFLWSGVAGDADLWLAVSNTHFNSGTRGLFADTAMSPQINNTYTLHFGIPSLDGTWAAIEFHNLSPGLIYGNTIYGAGTGSSSNVEYGVLLIGGNQVEVIGNLISGTKNAGIYINTTLATLVACNIAANLPSGVPFIQYGAIDPSNQSYGNQVNGASDINFQTNVLNSYGGLAVSSAAGLLSSANWAHQGGYIGWNYAGLGTTTFINSRGLGGGGFSFYDTATSVSATPSLLMMMQPNATGVNLTLPILTNAANDAAAASAGVPVGTLYRNGSIVMQRVV